MKSVTSVDALDRAPIAALLAALVIAFAPLVLAPDAAEACPGSEAAAVSAPATDAAATDGDENGDEGEGEILEPDERSVDDADDGSSEDTEGGEGGEGENLEPDERA